MGLSDVTGVLVPTHLDTQLILAEAGSTNPFRRVCRVETGVTNVYQSVNTGGVTHAWTAENAPLTDGAPSFANPTATAYKGTVLVPISYEAYEDARDREGEIMFLIADAIDNAEATAFATGNGTTQPRGLITALDANTQAEVATATDNVFAIADVYGLYDAVPARWRNERTAWFSNLAILNDIRQFGTDSLSTQTVDLTADGVTRIIGKAAYESSAMDGVIAAATKDNILAVGDPQTYLIYDRLGTSLEFVPNLMGTTAGTVIGQRAWVAHHRTGANLTVGHAANTTVGFRLLQAST
jgi:HK97 family phage major capsid protein